MCRCRYHQQARRGGPRDGRPRPWAAAAPRPLASATGPRRTSRWRPSGRGCASSTPCWSSASSPSRPTPPSPSACCRCSGGTSGEATGCCCCRSSLRRCCARRRSPACCCPPPRSLYRGRLLRADAAPGNGLRKAHFTVPLHLEVVPSRRLAFAGACPQAVLLLRADAAPEDGPPRASFHVPLHLEEEVSYVSGPAVRGGPRSRHVRDRLRAARVRRPFGVVLSMLGRCRPARLVRRRQVQFSSPVLRGRAAGRRLSSVRRGLGPRHRRCCCGTAFYCLLVAPSVALCSFGVDVTACFLPGSAHFGRNRPGLERGRRFSCRACPDR